MSFFLKNDDRTRADKSALVRPDFSSINPRFSWTTAAKSWASASGCQRCFHQKRRKSFFLPYHKYLHCLLSYCTTRHSGRWLMITRMLYMYVSTPAKRMYHRKSTDSPSVSNMTSRMYYQHFELLKYTAHFYYRCITIQYKSPVHYTQSLVWDDYLK